YRLKKLYISFLRFKRAFINYPFRKFNVIGIFLFWIREKLTRSQFLVLAGILVGFIAGFAGLLLKILVRQVQFFVANKLPFEGRLLVFALFPMLGILLTLLIAKYMFRGKEDKE